MTKQKEMSTKKAERGREIRVFISSTFRDMQAERDELVKRVFPQLRRICEQRGVTWSEVDLRWGITREQAEHGEALPICLQEIRGCRPFFIGILGERYGWVPDSVSDEMIDVEPWLKDHLAKSITEMEILHGVLNDPDMASRAYFYFRDPAYIETLPEEQRSVHLEIATEAEIKEYGREQAERRAELRRQRLADLKAQIKQSNLPLRSDYKDPLELGDLVLGDMRNVIDELFPATSKPSALERNRAVHEANRKKLSEGYVPRKDYFEQLDAFARGSGPPLAILGESGSGKSALLASWAARFHNTHPETPLLDHYIGSAADSSDWKAILRQMMQQIKHEFALEFDLPEEPQALNAAFSNLLARIPARDRLVLIFDGLNLLVDDGSALDLAWLPYRFPANIRVLVSTAQGRPLDEIKRRKWPYLSIEPLSTAERSELATQLLARYRKTLNSSQLERLANAPQCANPLFLSSLLEELRIFGVFEKLDERIDTYLQAEGITALYRLIFERYEQDYERHRPGLVEETMRLLWASRAGLSEPELMDLLGTDAGPLPHAFWSPLYLAMDRALVNQGGLLAFSNHHLLRAVEQRYLPSESERRSIHHLMADYFAARELGHRKAFELPWQLAHAEQWQRLSDLLASPEFFSALWEQNEYDVKRYWAELETNSDIRLIQHYTPLPEVTAQNVDFLRALGRLLHESGHPIEAQTLWEKVSAYFSEVDDEASIAGALGTRAVILREMGEMDQALEMFKSCEELYMALGDRRRAAGAITGQATILGDRGELEQSLALHQKSARIFEELDDAHGFVMSMGSQAILFNSLGEPDKALLLHAEEERLYRLLGDREGVALSLGNQALIHFDQGKHERALDLLKQKEALCRELGNSYSLANALGNQAAVHRALGDHSVALELHCEEEAICREIGDRSSLATSLFNQAAILHELETWNRAADLFGAAAGLYEEIGNLDSAAVALDHQAGILTTNDRLQQALETYLRLEKMAHQEGWTARLIMTMSNRGNILRRTGDLKLAFEVGEKQTRIARDYGDPGLLALTLFNHALLMIESGRDSQDALKMAKEAHRLAVDSGSVEMANAINANLAKFQ